MVNTPVLLSEQLPNDGTFRTVEFFKQATERLKRIGKHGKRASLKRQGKSVVLQFTFDGKQHLSGCSCQFTYAGIREAEKIAELVTLQLTANQFTWEWLNGLLGKKTVKKTEISQRSCKELIAEYKNHWFKEKKNNKNPSHHWYNSNRHLESVMESNNEVYGDNIARKVIESSQNNTVSRTKAINALINFCQYFKFDTNFIEQYKRKNKPKSLLKNVPNDIDIKRIYLTGFDVKCTRISYHYRYSQWRFLYGLLAVYGLRVHEAWNVANWDKPVTFNQGDWVAIEVGEREKDDIWQQFQGDEFSVPAIVDPNNKDYILCIKHNTKTGYRMAMPLCPTGEDWIKEFNLIQPNLNIPDIPNPLGRRGRKNENPYNCAVDTATWFSKKKYGFTPHALRHAYNHRGHSLGINPTVLSQSLGHSIQMNTSTYLKTMPEARKLENLRLAIENHVQEQSELEKALEINQILKDEILSLKHENELLKFQLQLVKPES